MNKLRRLTVLGLVATVTAVAGGFNAAQAATDTGNIAVSATVANVCRIGTGGNAGSMALAFGSYDPTSATDTDVTGTVNVHCTKNGSATITLDQGLQAAVGSTCAAPARQMADGIERLGYAIYSDAARTAVWGCDAANDVDFTDADGPSTFSTLTLYGRVPMQQAAAAGAYADTVVVTVTY